MLSFHKYYIKNNLFNIIAIINTLWNIKYEISIIVLSSAYFVSANHAPYFFLLVQLFLERIVGVYTYKL